MSIVSEQLIGFDLLFKLSEITNAGSEGPFASGPASNRPPTATEGGFAGYTYAGDPTMAALFGTTPPEEKKGAGNELLSSGNRPQYGGPLSNDTDTVLGSLAKLMSSHETHEWDNAAMEKTFTESRSTRSLKNANTVAGNNIPVASGGPFEGYQADNRYEISNWADVSATTPEEISSTGIIATGLRVLPGMAHMDTVVSSDDDTGSDDDTE